MRSISCMIKAERTLFLSLSVYIHIRLIIVKAMRNIGLTAKQSVTSLIYFFIIQYRTRISSPLMRAFASHRMRAFASHRIACGEMRACACIRITCAKCAHSHRMCAYARIRIACAEMRAYACIRIACAEMRALRRERRVNEIAGMTPARVFWCQTPETGFVVVRCIHKYWG